MIVVSGRDYTISVKRSCMLKTAIEAAALNYAFVRRQTIVDNRTEPPVVEVDDARVWLAQARNRENQPMRFHQNCISRRIVHE